MHLIWHGRGWVVPASVFGFSLISELITRSVTGDEQYYQNHATPIGLSLLGSAIIISIVYIKSYKIEYDEDGRVLSSSRPNWIDHSFFFISISVWPIILLPVWGMLQLSRGT